MLPIALSIVLPVVFSGPGPDPFGLAWGPGSWAGPAYTINKLDSDKDVNIMVVYTKNTFYTHE